MPKNQGSMLCPSCGKLISVGEERCPFCGAWRPGLYGWAPILQRFFGRQFDVLRLIMVVCVTLYVASLLLQPEAILSGGGGLFNFLSPGSQALNQLGMTGGIAWRQGWWWTVFTAIYLHGSLLHIFFNLMIVRNLAPGVNQVYGPARAFVIFTLSGAAGFVLSNLVSGSATVGASGSIFGLFAALIVYGRRVGHTMLTRQLWPWVIINFVLGFTMSGVNIWAHVGGFAGGWVIAEAMRFSDDKRESLGVQLLALGLLLVTAAGFVLSFVNVTAILMGK
jgi:rhomboid protease GluP